MASFKCNFLTILFIVFSLLLATQLSYGYSNLQYDEPAKVENPFIEETCKKTQYFNVCMEAFESSPLSKDATNITQVSQIAISIMKTMASDFLERHNKVFHNHTKCDFIECYTVIIKKLEKIISEGKHNRTEIIATLEFVQTQIKKVETSLNSHDAVENDHHGQKEIFLKLNKKFEQMCTITMTICQSLPSQYY